tara:strand:- start:196 stop:498 length:303 start_codon:yes stop_codon:yes gene_type:complete
MFNTDEGLKVNNTSSGDTIADIKQDTTEIKTLVARQQSKETIQNTEKIKQLEKNVKKLEDRIVENEKEMKKTAKKLGKSMNKMHEATGGNAKPPKFSGLK